MPHPNKPYPTFNALALRIDGAIAEVTFQNPPINLLDGPLVTELATLLPLLNEDPSLKVVVFQSGIPGYFLSHAHFSLLQTFRDRGAYDSQEMPLYSGMLEQLRTMPKATIAVVEGRARGGGAEFAVAADMCFAARETAFLSQMEIVMGILPGGGAAHYLARKVGRSRAMEICLGGGDFTACEAAAYGFVNRALPADELKGFVRDLTRRIASYSSRSIALNKAAVNHWEDGHTDALIQNNRWFAALVKDPEFDRRVDLFLNQGGETRDGEWADWASWAPKLEGS